MGKWRNGRWSKFRIAVKVKTQVSQVNLTLELMDTRNNKSTHKRSISLFLSRREAQAYVSSLVFWYCTVFLIFLILNYFNIIISKINSKII
jgi:1,4-dihydroxy-2-naphthoate octaprenyltransferase